MNKFSLLSTRALGLLLMAAPAVHAQLAITNGDFEAEPAEIQQTDVTGWFDYDGSGLAWWQQTSSDATDGISPFPNNSPYLFLSGATDFNYWAYQSVGTNSEDRDELSIQFDAGTLVDAQGNLDRTITIGLYQSDGTFEGAENVDIDGAEGVTLIDSFDVTTGPLTPGETVTLSGDLDLSSADGTSELFLRISNSQVDGGSHYTGIDNLAILDPERFSIVDHPVDVIVWSGSSAAFSMAVDSGQPYDIQWEVSTDDGETWATIDGATSESFVVEEAAVSIDRSQYRAVVTSGEETLVSDPAILRVGDATPPEPPEGVVAYYRFEDGSDGADATGAVDSSGNGNDLGVLVDGETGASPVFSSEVPSSRVPRSGDTNTLSPDFATGEVAFEGVDDEGLSNVVFDDITVEAWVNFSSTAGWQTFVGRDDRGDQIDNDLALFYFQKSDPASFFGGQFRVIWADREGDDNDIWGVVPEANTWYHVAVVGDSEAGTMTLYVNGAAVDSQEGFEGLFVPDPAPHWNIGRGQYNDNPVDWVNGRIDEVRFSTSALTPAEFLNFNTAVLNFAIQPEDIIAEPRDEVTFTSLAGGGGSDALSYQWQLSEDDGATWTDIPGATDPEYTIEAVELGDDGKRYRVVAVRGDATEISDVAVLEVTGFPDPVVVEGLEQGVLVFDGETFAYSVEATGLGNISYQWRQDGVDLEGETGPTLELEPVTADMDESVFSVVVSDDAAEQDEGLEPTSVTASAILNVAPRLKRAISLNFVGTSSDGTTWSDELGIINPDELAGAVPVANWNNSADQTQVDTQETPLELVDDMGESTTATATWSAVNTWAARTTSGPVSEKNPTDRLFHGYIEARSAAGDPATVTIEGIPFETYDVYVYPMGVEGAAGTFGRSVTMEDENGVRQLFMRNLLGNPTPEEIPLILSHATDIDTAMEGHMATYFRFAGASGDTVTLQHFDEVDWNSGGFAAVSIVDTSPSTPARPGFVERPADRFVPAGEEVEFSVSAESFNEGGSLSYQWQKDGEDLAGETGATLTLTNVGSADAGRYTVVVTDDSDLGTSINTASAFLVVVDESRFALLNVDMNVAGEPMSGNGMLLPDGLLVWVAPANDSDNPMNIGEGDSFWNSLIGATGTTTYGNLVDSEGLALPGLTFTVEGATGAEDDVDGGGLETFDADPNYSAPLFRDYVFTEGEDEMTLTVGGLNAFAGLDVTLVVYALGKDSRDWPDADGQTPDQDDEATVTLAGANTHSEVDQAPVKTDQQGGDDNDGGREMRWNDKSFAAFDARVAANGIVSWTVGPVDGEPGLNAFDGFQILITNQGEALEPEGIADWRQTHFGSSTNEGDAANDADPDGDGFKNLVEYALGTDPTVAGDGPSALSQGQAGDFLTLTFDHIADSNLTYAVEATNDVDGPWTEVQNYGSFATSGTQTFTDDQPISANSQRFLRLKVTVSE